MIRQFFCVLSGCAFVAALQAIEQPITIAEVAQVTGYPAEKLSVRDETATANEKALRKKKPECISHHVFSSNDDTFATVSVAVGKRGTLLTPELGKKADEMIEKAALRPGAPGKVRRIDFGDGIRGYSGLGMAGGGGSMDRSVITLPDHNRDIQITILFGENALTPLNGAEQYQGAVITSDGVNAIITKCLAAVSKNVIASLGQERTTESPVLPKVQQIKATAPSEQAVPKDAAVMGPKNHTTKESSSTWLWWLLGLVVVVLALIANALRK
mgnify:CR=1 FL=1